MCDTLVMTRTATADAVALFAKNSDRDPNEAHHVLLAPAADHPPGSRVRCTYIEIEQAPHTYAVALAKPFWMWGAEMGVNEHGVVIGNEALFTRQPAEKEARLLGMDLLRLALERAATARAAVEVITALLERYGQGGNCGFAHPLYYQNSFLIADPDDAWVLETVDKHWAARRVQGSYSISNAITLSKQWDMASPDLVTHAIEQGWCKSAAEFDFAEAYSDFLYTRLSDARKRCAATLAALQTSSGRATPTSMFAALRLHTAADAPGWSPARGLTGATVCMHAGYGPVRRSQTTGSLVAYLHPARPLLFVTGTAAPCTSIFKPLWLDTPLPEAVGPAPTGVYDPHTLFWRHERLHRSLLRDYPQRITILQEERALLEQELLEEALAACDAPLKERRRIVAEGFSRALAAEERWLTRMAAAPPSQRQSFWHARAWASFNRAAGVPTAALV
ncbi:MAG TPA: peptidase U34 [Chloroflexi bacterium]|nr:peptidase U34 [Chloroflexota bacterium]HHW88728.1 peptidase U34 [Chloroflexota bacterium]